MSSHFQRYNNKQLTNSFAWFHNERDRSETSPVNFFMGLQPFSAISFDTGLHRDIQLYSVLCHLGSSSGLMNSTRVACASDVLTSSSSRLAAAERDTRTDQNPEHRLPAQQRGECDVPQFFRFHQRNALLRTMLVLQRQ